MTSAITSRTETGRRTGFAGAIGSLLEWYDFTVYGFLAPILGKLFFPSDDPTASLLAAFGVFAIGYAARPLGGAFFGHVGDKFGRKPAMIISAVLMGLATLGIGLLPDHAQIGTTAALLLVALRIFQGLSVGGHCPAWNTRDRTQAAAVIAARVRTHTNMFSSPVCSEGSGVKELQLPWREHR